MPSEVTQNEGLATALARYGSVVTPPLTSSMWPMLRARRDCVLLIPANEQLAVGDVALYQATDSVFVLHRVVEITDTAVIFRGDRNPDNDAPVPRNAVIAVMQGFYRGERYIPADAMHYRIYARLWPKLGLIRKAVIRIDRFFYYHSKKADTDHAA